MLYTGLTQRLYYTYAAHVVGRSTAVQPSCTHSPLQGRWQTVTMGKCRKKRKMEQGWGEKLGLCCCFQTYKPPDNSEWQGKPGSNLTDDMFVLFLFHFVFSTVHVHSSLFLTWNCASTAQTFIRRIFSISLNSKISISDKGRNRPSQTFIYDICLITKHNHYQRRPAVLLQLSFFSTSKTDCGGEQ